MLSGHSFDGPAPTAGEASAHSIGAVPTIVKGVPSRDQQRGRMADTNMAIPETFAERAKLALKGAGLTISELARLWGVDRSALSERISSDRMDEEELGKLASLVKQPKAWLRYGVRGDFAAGVTFAATEIRACIDRLLHSGHGGGTPSKVFDVEVGGEVVHETKPTKRQKRGR